MVTPPPDILRGAAYLFIVCTTATIWSLLVLAIRVFLRISINGPFGKDDFACMVATVVGIIHASLVISQIFLGLGRHESELASAAVDLIFLLIYIARFFYTFALCFSQLSVCMLIARITRIRRHLVATYSVSGMSVLLAVAASAVHAFECRLPKPWIMVPETRCLNRRYLAFGLCMADIFIELAIFATAVFLVWGVQIRLKDKAVVLIAFALRLLIIPPAICRLFAVRDLLSSNDEIGERLGVSILSQIVMHLSVITATIPCAKPFLACFDTGQLTSMLRTTATATGIKTRDSRIRPTVRSTPLFQQVSKDYFASAYSRMDNGITASRQRPHCSSSTGSRNLTPNEQQHRYEASIRHVPSDDLRDMRMRSSSLDGGKGSFERGIMMTQSFRVCYENADGEV